MLLIVIVRTQAIKVAINFVVRIRPAPFEHAVPIPNQPTSNKFG